MFLAAFWSHFGRPLAEPLHHTLNGKHKERKERRGTREEKREGRRGEKEGRRGDEEGSRGEERTEKKEKQGGKRRTSLVYIPPDIQM